VTRIGLAGPPTLNNLIPIDVTVPIDLYVSQPGNPEGGCVIGPIIQDLAADEDPEGDLGAILAGDSTMGGVSGRTGNFAIVGTGTLTADAFEVPAARGCGALTTVINTLLGLPSPSGANSTSLPFSQFITGFGG
jgi:hypothetical protein